MSQTWQQYKLIASMDGPSTLSPAPSRTTFLVPSIHCPTCTSFIEDLLAGLKPKPESVEASILSHSVTVTHDASLTPRVIARTLANSGYEVVSDSVSGGSALSTNTAGGDDDFPFVWLNRITERWQRKREVAAEETRRRRHKEHCQQCRSGIDARHKDSREKASRSGPPSPQTGTNRPFVVVESASATSDVFDASITISGMSCSSCVGKITSALEEKPWVLSANVALLTQNASVRFAGQHSPDDLIRAITSLGYNASLEQVEKLPVVPTSKLPASKLWKASLSIEGMTCSSCVGSITSSLKNLPFTKTVDVNLITSSCTIVFEDKDNILRIRAAIEELGYKAKLDDILDATNDEAQNSRRAVSIRIDGMYCQHCPARVTEAMNQFGDRIIVETPATLHSSLLTISYVPEAPGFTIRAILAAISTADAAFNATIYHPPTIEERAAQMHRRIRQRIFYRVLLSLVVAIPTFIVAIVFMTLVPSTNPSRMYLMEPLRGVTRAEWAAFIMATPVYFFAADVFHRRAIKELHSLWRPGSTVPVLRRFYRFGSMDMLMSFGTTIAYISSVVEIIIASTAPNAMNMKGNVTYFDSVVFLTMFLLLGRLIEAYSKAKTGEAVTTLSKLRPNEALLVLPDDGTRGASQTRSVSADVIDTGDLVRVVHGASPPWDGVLLDEVGEFDESSLTGESKVVKKAAGDALFSGTVNKGGPVTIRTTSTSGESMLDQIIKVVREGQAKRAPIERLADTLTSYFVPVVTLIAISTWLIWLSLGLSGSLPKEYLDVEIGSWPFWSLQFAIAVFIIACPCGIGLAAPTALFVGGGLAAKHGILVKGGGEAFQEASKLDIIVFDKTGTLTQGGEPKVTDHQFLPRNDDSWSETTILSVLKELEENSSHPIGKAIVDFCQSRETNVARADHIEEIAGKGMTGTFTVGTLPNQVQVLAGNEALLTDHDITLDEDTSAALDLWKGQAKSIVLVAARPTASTAKSPWNVLAIFATSDPLRPESRHVVETLRSQGVDVWMISGDNVTTARAVGAMVGISPENIIAGVLPEQKADNIKYLQKSQANVRSESSSLGRNANKQRAIVAMVGDGVNDSPALTVADVGIAIGSGSDVAVSAAEFVLVNPSLTTLLTLVSLSRTVFRRVKFNFGWALVYNLVAMPIAAGVLYPIRSNGQHIRLDPVWASLAMALSSVSVICSSLLLRSKVPVVGFTEKVWAPSHRDKETSE